MLSEVYDFAVKISFLLKPGIKPDVQAMAELHSSIKNNNLASVMGRESTYTGHTTQQKNVLRMSEFILTTILYNYLFVF